MITILKDDFQELLPSDYNQKYKKYKVYKVYKVYKCDKLDYNINTVLREYKCSQLIKEIMEMEEVEDVCIFGGVIRNCINNNKIQDIDVNIIINNLNSLLNFCFFKKLFIKLKTFYIEKNEVVYFSINNQEKELFHGKIIINNLNLENDYFYPLCSKMIYFLNKKILIAADHYCLNSILSKKVICKGKKIENVYTIRNLLKQYWRLSLEGYGWDEDDIKFLFNQLCIHYDTDFYNKYLKKYFNSECIKKAKEIQLNDAKRINFKQYLVLDEILKNIN